MRHQKYHVTCYLAETTPDSASLNSPMSFQNDKSTISMRIGTSSLLTVSQKLCTRLAGVCLGRYLFFHKLLLKGAVSWELSNFKQWKLSPNWVNSTYKTRHGWTNLKKIKRDCNKGFWKLVSLTVFQSPFLLFVTFNIMIERHFFEMKLWFCYFPVNFSLMVCLTAKKDVLFNKINQTAVMSQILSLKIAYCFRTFQSDSLSKKVLSEIDF